MAILEWAADRGCHWSKRAWFAAAAAGHLNVLRWAVAKGFTLHKNVCAGAALNGHLTVLRWAREQGCAFHPSVCAIAAGSEARGSPSCQYGWCSEYPMVRRLEDVRAQLGRIEVLVWAAGHGAYIRPGSTASAKLAAIQQTTAFLLSMQYAAKHELVALPLDLIQVIVKQLSYDQEGGSDGSETNAFPDPDEDAEYNEDVDEGVDAEYLTDEDAECNADKDAMYNANSKELQGYCIDLKPVVFMSKALARSLLSLNFIAESSSENWLSWQTCMTCVSILVVLSISLAMPGLATHIGW